LDELAMLRQAREWFPPVVEIDPTVASRAWKVGGDAAMQTHIQNAHENIDILIGGRLLWLGHNLAIVRKAETPDR